VQALRSLLAELRARDVGVRREQESADTRARLAALGYVSAAQAPLKQAYDEDDDPKRLVDLDAMLQRVIALHREGRLREALEICEEMVRRRPQMSISLIQLGMLHRGLGQLPDAIAALRRAFALNPDDLGPAVLLAGYLSEAGEAAEAADLLQAYAARPEPDLDVLTQRGVALAQAGRSQEALETFARARELDPSNPMTLVQMATVHLTVGAREPARDALEEALRQNPDLALAHHNLGLLALGQDDDQEAERRFRRALELEPDEHDALLNLGSLLARRGSDEEARPYLERFVRGAPRPLYDRQIAQAQAWLRRTSS
jgi:tetratricopeptide (TPR) repeat protein